MKKMIILAILAIVILAAGCTQQAGPSNGQNQTTIPPAGNGQTSTSVAISNFAFDPATITIDKGSTVAWVNKDSVAHTITGTGFDSGSFETGQNYSRKFDQSGTFEYYCAIHPSMKGTVVVK